MTESKKHLLLKELAKIILSKEFKKYEIKTEYKITTFNKKQYIVDVVGINNKKSVAIECGNLSTGSKLKDLSDYFDNIIHLPYYDSKIFDRKDILVTTILPYEMLKKVNKVAKFKNVPRNTIIRYALCDYLDKKLLMIGDKE